MKELEFETNRKYQLIDITSEVEEVVVNAGVEEGLCLVFVPTPQQQ